MEEEKIFEIVRSRHSVRSYVDRPIADETVAKLQSFIDNCNKESGLHLQLVTNEPEAFGKSLMAHYGKFRNVNNYICLVGKKSNIDRQIGYYGEKVVIYAQELGLNTCWVGLSFSKRNARCDVSKDEKLYAIIAVGYGETQGVPHKCKTPEQICGDIGKMPEWFRRGVEFALLAPTAINQQKFRFALTDDGAVKASTSWGPYAKIDLGIACYHFELGAGRPVRWA